jgi:hypothetical protein
MAFDGQIAILIVDGEDQATASEQAPAIRIFVAIVFLNRHGVAVCSVECHARGIRQGRLPRQKSKWQSCLSNARRERRMPELWQFVKSNAIAWHSSARIAIGLVTEGLSQPRSSLQNTVRSTHPHHFLSMTRWGRNELNKQEALADAPFARLAILA